MLRVSRTDLDTPPKTAVIIGEKVPVWVLKLVLRVSVLVTVPFGGREAVAGKPGSTNIP